MASESDLASLDGVYCSEKAEFMGVMQARVATWPTSQPHVLNKGKSTLASQMGRGHPTHPSSW